MTSSVTLNNQVQAVQVRLVLEVWWFPKIWDNFLVVRILVICFWIFWYLYWGPPISGNYRIGLSQSRVC